MKKAQTILLLLFVPILTHAQNRIYEKDDSIRIERILSETNCKEYTDNGERILDIANEFLGEQYIASTLENGDKEPLYISCTRLDCTTFVELVLAISIASDNGQGSFSDVCNNLERIRYRNGKRDGYTSRLHYTSWWIDDNIEKGIIEEVNILDLSKRTIIDLHYMSRNHEKYPMLKEDTHAVSVIEQMEKRYRGVSVSYIPKDFLDKSQDSLSIKNGDIIMLVTTIDGLDISHMGFAFWKKGKLHLMHASSSRMEVIKDDATLYEYQKKRKSQSGIRVLRLL